MQLDRIVGSKKIPPSDDKIAVLLLHGLFDCSASWLLPGSEKGLGITNLLFVYRINFFKCYRSFSLFFLFFFKVIDFWNRLTSRISFPRKSKFTLTLILCTRLFSLKGHKEITGDYIAQNPHKVQIF